MNRGAVQIQLRMGLTRRKRATFWLIVVAIIGSPVIGTELYLRHLGLGDPIIAETRPFTGQVLGAGPDRECKKGETA